MNRRLAFAQLLRIPNVFTALSDVGIGLIVGSASLVSGSLIAIASAALYCSGMVGNDYFDRHIDADERPQRPIPSGRIAAQTAQHLMIALLVVGIIAAAAAGWKDDRLAPLAIAAALALLIVSYNAGLKNTFTGPMVIGSCRSLNVLLGFAVIDTDVVPWPTRLIIAAIVGVYIGGVTIFARDEVGQSQVDRLIAAAIVIFGALGVTIAVPTLGTASGRSLAVPLVALFATHLGFVILSAIRQPSPRHVQVVIKTAILGLIVLDAALATSLAGPVGLLLLLLAIPANVAGRWVYST